MQEHLILILAVLLLTGCGTNPELQAPMNDQPQRAEMRTGDDPDESPQLSFRITTVHEHQKPSADAPYHTERGEWTFFDCHANSDPKVVFTVGVSSKSSDGGGLSAWGKAVLIVRDGESGARFVEAFSKAFSGRVPTVVKRRPVPVPLTISTAILGQNMNRDRGGGFSAAAGGWTATKWLPEYDGLAGEIFFNYNLAERQGEFSEKDADYADDLVAIFASA